MQEFAKHTLFSIGEFTSIAICVIVVFLLIDKKVSVLKVPTKFLVSFFIGLMAYIIGKTIALALLGPSSVTPW